MRLLCRIALLLVVPCIGLSSAATNLDIEAKKFVDDAAERYYRLYDQIATEMYNFKGVKDYNVLLKQARTVKQVGKELTQLSKEAREFDRDKIHDPEVLAALNYFRRIANLFVLDEDNFNTVLLNLKYLKELSTAKNTLPYFDGPITKHYSSIAYYPDVQEMVRSSNDTNELKHYWEMWRNMNSLWATTKFNNIVDAMQNAADILEIDILDLWNSKKDPNFIVEMEKVMEELAPAYKQLHAFIRHQLYEKYGADVVDLTAPIPAHLFEQVIEQAWHDGSIIESYFPHDELPPYNSFVKHFDGKQLVMEAVGFYKSLGFDDLDEDFYKNHLMESDEDPNGAECRADIFDSTPNVYMKYCLKVDFRKFLQNHGYVGRVYYAKQKKNLPAYYFDSYDLEYPLGESVILSASTPKHLKSIGLATDFKFDDKTLKNRLARMGIHTMLNVPLFFVHTKVMNDILNKTIDKESVNKHYWKLMEKFVGVEPAVDRELSFIDFPHKFYLDLEQNYQAKKFISEILGYQLYSAFCKQSGETEPLHNCDFYGNKSVGDAMKAMMSLGSSKPWHEVLARVLPESQNLSGTALLEYYEPILDWVKARNEEFKVSVGWAATKKKIL